MGAVCEICCKVGGAVGASGVGRGACGGVAACGAVVGCCGDVRLFLRCVVSVVGHVCGVWRGVRGAGCVVDILCGEMVGVCLQSFFVFFAVVVVYLFFL